MADNEQDTVKSGEDWIRLVSDDGHSFLIKRKVAMGSGTLRNMLSVDSSFSESASNTCPVHERAIVVEKMCEYLQFKYTYESASPKENVPDFNERIPPELALELGLLRGLEYILVIIIYILCKKYHDAFQGRVWITWASAFQFSVYVGLSPTMDFTMPDPSQTTAAWLNSASLNKCPPPEGQTTWDPSQHRDDSLSNLRRQALNAPPSTFKHPACSAKHSVPVRVIFLVLNIDCTETPLDEIRPTILNEKWGYRPSNVNVKSTSGADEKAVCVKAAFVRACLFHIARAL
ncbi:hypothetical protein EW026_g1103 [Hermanssonia centrifuga]|uniref:Elongin-C n=1 Tax=Hermanssonia centrifuga TaxID=98765 RepID=A0A4S4KSP4_9APHY|nr:hypothetical protein EW026_g1103 [Hermanssonia centrifuga]